MTFETLDFLTDASVLGDPSPYYDYLRECPVRHVPPYDVVAVSGYDELVSVFRDIETYSMCNTASGPFPPLPMEPGAHDVTDVIEEHREIFPISEHFATFDPPKHTDHRALLMRFLTPKRLEDSEPFMRGLADRLIDEFHAAGRCDFIADYAYPFALLSIASVLGVPEEDHELFLGELRAYTAGSLEKPLEGNPFDFMDPIFLRYVEDRRKNPQADVITKMATATFPDGTLPDALDVVRMAVFVEETLRFESPTKVLFLMARRTHELDGCPVKAGDTIMAMPGAANRDARHFEDPNEFRLDRANVRDHVAFGRGIHACPGGSLVRQETRVSLNRVLDRMGDIRISEEHHGPVGDRHYEWKPSFMLRGLQALQLEFTPVG